VALATTLSGNNDQLQRTLTNDKELQDQMQNTAKWNPVTFALYQGNLEVLKYLLHTSICNTKKLLKVPGLFNTQMISRVFPFAVALAKANTGMFAFFWDEMGYLWDEETLDNLFSMLAKREMADYLTMLFDSRTSRTIFAAMSYQYRFTFVEHLLQTRSDLLEEIKLVVLQDPQAAANITDEDDAEEFILQKKMGIDHFYMKVYEELSKQPYSLYFYL
jgi:hypothetical protein